MARGTTSYYGRRYTIATPMTHLYMLCACIFCWIVGYVDSVGYPVYGEVTAPPLWNALCLVFPGKLFTYLIGFFADGRWCVSGASGKLCVDVDS